eukprot:gene3241-3552_t
MKRLLFLQCISFNLFASLLLLLQHVGVIKGLRLVPSSPLPRYRHVLQSSTTTISDYNNSNLDKIQGFEELTDLGFNLWNHSLSDEESWLHASSDIQPLLKDIELLSSILGEVIHREDEDIYNLYKDFCQQAIHRSYGDVHALKRMISSALEMPADQTLGVVRAFTQTLNLINAAEVHHRMRNLRNADMETNRLSPLPTKEDSVAGAIESIIGTYDNDDNCAIDPFLKDAIYHKLTHQTVDLVLTAHPTEVNRRTLLRKYRTISEILATLDRKDMTPFERSQAIYSLKREVASIWGSDEIRRQKPSPQQEARGGLAILESVLWDAVPSYLRKLNLQCIQSLGKALPLDRSPIKFSSWMGGDRDGNPNVTPKVTYEVAITQRLQAAKLLLNDVVALYKELAICKGFSFEMRALAFVIKRSFDRRELYRRVLGHIRVRLHATIAWCERELRSMNAEFPLMLHISSATGLTTGAATASSGQGEAFVDFDGKPFQISAEEEDKYREIAGEPDQPLFDSQELLDILLIMHSSLSKSGYADVADGLLVDLIRRVTVFGLTLVPLDIRQESSRHTQVLDAITRYLGIGSYAQWDEKTRINWLITELSGKRPLFRADDLDNLDFEEKVMDTLRTFEMIASLGTGSLGAYVISQATAASDVLAVMLLQKQFGIMSSLQFGEERGAEAGKRTKHQKPLRVVPLFETLQDLTNAAQIVETLFSIPSYLAMIRHKQEIMVGYSDSAKDAGRLAACWAQYESQERISKVAVKYGVQLTFFHGKGGTVGRGGNPALYRAVLAHPPGTINGKFRVTEQGEMITQNFGSTGIAERTLDIYTAAVLAEQFAAHTVPEKKWRDVMREISRVSCDSYRTMISDPTFIQYFRTATPEVELSSLNIGSRPSKRNVAGGIESLRAIPWMFAWTQTRLHLPAWLGVGEALDPENNGNALYDSKDLHEMYMKWPFFREMIDLIAMTLSKTDYSISANYELQLTGSHENKEVLEGLGHKIRDILVKTRKRVLQVTGCGDLSNGFRLLQMSMKVRYPYVDPLNVLQAEILRRLRMKSDSATEITQPGFNVTRSQSDDSQILQDALVVSINGIAQGMKNSG